MMMNLNIDVDHKSETESPNMITRPAEGAISPKFNTDGEHMIVIENSPKNAGRNSYDLGPQFPENKQQSSTSAVMENPLFLQAFVQSV